MNWKKVNETPPPEDHDWILVRNSTGFYAAVNELARTREGYLSGYAVTPEQSLFLTSDIVEWTEITP